MIYTCLKTGVGIIKVYDTPMSSIVHDCKFIDFATNELLWALSCDAMVKGLAACMAVIAKSPNIDYL